MLSLSIRKFLIAIILMSPWSPLMGKSVQQMEAGGWKLTFQDEFNGKELDQTKWTPHYNYTAIINHELQAYVPDAFTLDNGVLHIMAKHEPGFQDGHTQQYRSGAMTSSGKFSQLFGYYEIRCKLPKGQGFWPAFWLLSDGGQWPPEVDIFENLGHENTTLHFTNHWKDQNGQHQSKSQSTKGPDYTADFHTIAIDWEPASIVWYVDDREQCRVTENIPTGKMYLLVNLAVGGDWPGPPNAATPFPSSFDVDYVRVYQRPGSGPGAGPTN